MPAKPRMSVSRCCYNILGGEQRTELPADAIVPLGEVATVKLPETEFSFFFAARQCATDTNDHTAKRFRHHLHLPLTAPLEVRWRLFRAR